MIDFRNRFKAFSRELHVSVAGSVATLEPYVKQKVQVSSSMEGDGHRLDACNRAKRNPDFGARTQIQLF